MIKKLTFIITLIFGLVILCYSTQFGLVILCYSTQNEFKLKIGNNEYIITANNINDAFIVVRDTPFYTNMTPLIYASYSGNIPLAKFSIENGANVNANQYDYFGYKETALEVALKKENWEMLKYLVEHGADIEVNDNFGWSPLTSASLNGKFEVVKYLVELGADVNAENNSGWSPLISATYYGNLEIVKYLIKNGADINHYLYIDGRYYGNALIFASMNGDLEMVKYLVEHGADVNSKGDDGWNALMYASMNRYKGHSDVSKYLTEKGASINYEAVGKEPKLTDKYLFATLKGKIDDKHDITMNIKISISYSWTGEMSGYVSGNYHYDRFGKNIYFTKGTINKNSMIIEADNEVFNFKLDEAILNNILELKNSSKNISINGDWGDKYKHFTCTINSVSPLGGKLSEMCKYNVSGEVAYDDDWYRYSYDEDALYSPSINVSYLDGELFRNVEKIDIKTLKNVMKENFKRFTIYDMNNSMAFFTNDFRIGYFDSKILCLEEYVYEHNGGAHPNTDYYPTIISLENGEKLNNRLFKDLVDYSEEFKEFFKKEFVKYHTEYNKETIEFYEKSEVADALEFYFSPDYIEIIFNNDGTVDIYNPFAEVFRGFIKTKIEMKKLKPYIKKDSFYRYLFD